jgi:2-iminobutanoate/2-iminopropanoate deaminase
MKREILAPEGVWNSSVYSFSQGIAVDRPSRIVFVAGQTSIDEMGNVVGKGDIRAQTKLAFDNVERVLRSGGCRLGDVVKLNIYVKRQKDFFEVMKIRRRIMGRKFPASTLVQVRNLVYPTLLVEVDAIAVK